MAISGPGADETESRRHLIAIEKLSKELHIPVEVLSESYEQKLKEIEKTAKIKDFIVLLVAHDLKDHLRSAVTV